jgi:hypothetical protein
MAVVVEVDTIQEAQAFHQHQVAQEEEEQVQFNGVAIKPLLELQILVVAVVAVVKIHLGLAQVVDQEL